MKSAPKDLSAFLITAAEQLVKCQNTCDRVLAVDRSAKNMNSQVLSFRVSIHARLIKQTTYKQIGCFNCRVVTMVAWFTVVVKATV